MIIDQVGLCLIVLYIEKGQVNKLLLTRVGQQCSCTK